MIPLEIPMRDFLANPIFICISSAYESAAVELEIARTDFGDVVTIADIALGAFARRWFGVEGVTKPKLPHLERWFGEIAQRPAFVRIVAPPMS